MADGYVDRLMPILLAGDLVAARELIDSLAPEDLPEARAWHAKAGRWWRDNVASLDTRLQEAAVDSDERRARLSNAEWILDLATIELFGRPPRPST